MLKDKEDCKILQRFWKQKKQRNEKTLGDFEKSI